MTALVVNLGEERAGGFLKTDLALREGRPALGRRERTHGDAVAAATRTERPSMMSRRPARHFEVIKTKLPPRPRRSTVDGRFRSGPWRRNRDREPAVELDEAARRRRPATRRPN
jgi:hypothetical protein